MKTIREAANALGKHHNTVSKYMKLLTSSKVLTKYGPFSPVKKGEGYILSDMEFETLKFLSSMSDKGISVSHLISKARRAGISIEEQAIPLMEIASAEQKPRPKENQPPPQDNAHVFNLIEAVESKMDSRYSSLSDDFDTITEEMLTDILHLKSVSNEYLARIVWLERKMEEAEGKLRLMSDRLESQMDRDVVQQMLHLQENISNRIEQQISRQYTPPPHSDYFMRADLEVIVHRNDIKKYVKSLGGGFEVSLDSTVDYEFYTVRNQEEEIELIQINEYTLGGLKWKTI